MDGFGPIAPEPESEEPYFHAPWERRAFAVTLAMGALGQWSIDAARYARERQHPVEYLNNSYYENWIAGLETLLVEKGIVTEDELAAGHAKARAADELVARKLMLEKVAPALAKGSPTTLDDAVPQRFAIGDEVRVLLNKTTGHTRAPRYARGRRGRVAKHHGVHIFADKSAEGIKEGQHLYSVCFDAADLWGEGAIRHGAVYIDLWDGHLEPA
jgi:nitrile hydratase